ncbi:MAG: hypothetical protein ACYSRZ_06725, partial [Planctomycetota bacterium]
RGVEICDSKFPYTLKDITGRINFTEKSLSLNNLIGRHGDVEVKINGWSTDYGPDRKYDIQITSDNMVLDKDLYNALSDRHKKAWDSFCPAGTAAIDYQRSRTPQTGRGKSITAELIDVNAAYKKFPYPLRNLTGKICFEPASVTISNLTSRTSLSKIVLDGKVTQTKTERPIYDITVAAENIPLDSTLAAALTKDQQHCFSQLNMTGFADANVNIFTPEQSSQPTSFISDIDLKQTSMRLEQFPLPVSEITAGLTYRPGFLEVKDFKGLCQDGSIAVTGRIWPVQKDRQSGYCLSIDANAINLSEDFINTMPAHVKNVLCKTQPAGKINLTADLNKNTPDHCADYKVVVDCLGNSVNSEIFPYSFKDITGRLTLTADDITFHDLQAAISKADTAQPGIPQVKINGRIQLSENTLKNGQFDLSVQDIIFDEKLTPLLNEAVRPFYRKFAPAGRFDLHCQDIKLSQTIDGEKYVDFSAVLELKNCSLKTSPEITDLNLSLQTNCQYKIGYGFCSDYNVLVKAESLRIMGKALTDFNAAVSYDQKQHSFSSENFIADCYDGRVTGKFQLTQAGPDVFKYSLQSGFCEIDLKRFLSDGAENTKSANGRSKTTGYTTGSMDGSFSLGGVFADEVTRVGQCRLAIHNMQVGKLSPIAKLLAALELTESTDYAFDRMLLDSYIKEDKMFLRELDLSGRSAAFNGSGSLDLNDNTIDLDLTARSRRHASEEPSLWQSFTEGLGTAVVKMEVDGNIYDPKVKTTALPVIKATLGLLGKKPDS